MATRASLFPARVAIGRATFAGQEVLVYATPELSRALRTVEESVDAVESGLAASEIINVPAGSIAATNVQDALDELATEKASATALTSHTSNTSNPHSTTAAQVGAVAVNAAITGATKTKITYDAKGLITAGADATTADIADSLNKRYVTDAQLTSIGALGTMASQNASNVTITGGSVTTGTGAIGYSTGNGGTVTQGILKSIGVTLDERFGEITMDNASLAAGATVSFTLTNSTIAANDYVHVQHVSAGTMMAYQVNAVPASGSATIYVKNTTAGSLSEAIVLRFYVFKGSLS